MRVLRRRTYFSALMLVICFVICLYFLVHFEIRGNGFSNVHFDSESIHKLDDTKGHHKFVGSEKTGNIWKNSIESGLCIGAVVVLRIYTGDKAELTTLEVEQWIRYLQYAGVDIIYMYDAYEQESEKLESWTESMFLPRELIYHDWHLFTPYDVQKTQLSAYQHATHTFRNSCKWHLAMDIDEYPFVLSDPDPGFLKRFVSNFSSANPTCSEISFKNSLFSGYPKDFLWLVERFQRRFPKIYNALDKPMYIAEHVDSVGLHHNILKKGLKSIDVDENIARMNQYWGGRLQDWTKDTEQTLSKTIPDESIIRLLKQLKQTPLRSTLGLKVIGLRLGTSLKSRASDWLKWRLVAISANRMLGI